MKTSLGLAEIKEFVSYYNKVVHIKPEKGSNWSVIIELHHSITEIDYTIFSYLCLFKNQFSGVNITVSLTPTKNNTTKGQYILLHQLIAGYACIGKDVYDVLLGGRNFTSWDLLTSTKRELSRFRKTRDSKSIKTSVGHLSFNFPNRYIGPLLINNENYAILFKSTFDVLWKEIFLTTVNENNILHGIENYLHNSGPQSEQLLTLLFDELILGTNAINCDFKLFCVSAFLTLLDELEYLRKVIENEVLLPINNGLVTSQSDKIDFSYSGFLKSDERKNYFNTLAEYWSELMGASPIEIFWLSLLTTQTLSKTTRVKNPQKYLEEFIHLIGFNKQVIIGLRELAKNVVEHSTHKTGILLGKIYNQKALELLHIDKKDIYNKKLHDYFSSQNNVNDSIFVDVILIDNSELGVLDTAANSFKESVSRFSYNKEVADELNLDVNKITTGEVSFQDLFRTDKFSLSHQMKRAISRIGLQSFAHLIHNNKGLFRSSTISGSNGGYSIIGYPIVHNEWSNLGIEQEQHPLFSLGTYYNFKIPISKQRKYSTVKLPDRSETMDNSSVFESLIDYELIKFSNIPLPKLVKSKFYVFDFSYNEILFLIRKQFTENIPPSKYENTFLISAYLKNAFLENKINIGASILAIDLQNVQDLNTKGTASELFRFLAHLQLEQIFPSIILYNVEYDVLDELFDIVKRFNQMSPSLDFWDDRYFTLFYSAITDGTSSVVQNNSNPIYFTSLLGMKSFEECAHINNKILANYHFMIDILLNDEEKEKVDSISANAIINKVRNNVLFNKEGKLLYFDLILKQDRLTLFEHSIKSILNRSIDGTE